MTPDGVLSTTTRVLRVRTRLPRSDPPSEYADDICFSPDLVASFIEAYTGPGDLVFDPFAGFGTTVRTAEQMGRRALGFEIDESRVAFARQAWPTRPGCDRSVCATPTGRACRHPSCL